MTRIDSNPPTFLKELQELYNARYLLKRLVLRDLKVRYNNTLLGVLWNVLQPLSMMLIFVFFLSFVFKDHIYGIPAPIYTYSALCLWHFFSRGLNQGSFSFIYLNDLITKVYFPRFIAPLSYVIATAADFLVAYGLLILLQLVYGIFNLHQFLYVPFIFLGLFIFVLSLSSIIAVLSIRYRDAIHVLPLLIQLWLFCCPIMYPYTVVPKAYLWFYHLNPLVGYIQLFRYAITPASPMPPVECVMSSVGVTLFLSIISIRYFLKKIPTIVDEL